MTNSKKYRILISGMAYDQGKSGISDYMNNVIPLLASEHQVDLLLLEDDQKFFSHLAENIKFITVPEKLRKAVFNMLWHLYILPGKLDFSCYDFIFLPAANRRVLARYPIPTIVTFHDLSQFHIKAKYDAFRMFYIKKLIPHYIKKAHRILAISKNTKDDLVKFYKFKPDQISVNYNGYNRDRFFPAPNNPKKPLGIQKKYFLYIARLEHPGKNHLRLIKAYELLPEDIKGVYDLVLPGKAWSGSDKIMEYIKKSPDKERIHFPGFVPADILPSLYQQSSLYIFPSLYEGFGIPLIEAMASGVPVVCSNTSSLPEIGGDAVALFDPYSVDSIRDTVLRVISGPKMQDAMIQNGFKQITRFSWKVHAQKIIDAFEDTIKSEKK